MESFFTLRDEPVFMQTVDESDAGRLTRIRRYRDMGCSWQTTAKMVGLSTQQAIALQVKASMAQRARSLAG